MGEFFGYFSQNYWVTRKTTLTLLLSSWALLGSLTLSGIAVAGPADYDVSKLYEKYNHGHQPGVAVMVIKDGKMIHQTGYGEAQLEADEKLPENSHAKIDEHIRFNLASDSKQFTAFGALLLADDGKLNLNASIRDYLPQIPKSFQNVTVSDLIYHRSGLPGYTQEGEGVPADYKHMTLKPGPGGTYSNETVLKFIQTHPKPEFVAGSKHVYSDTGYVVLAQLIEKVSGHAHLGDFLQERVFKPLGMNETQYYRGPKPVIPHRAIGYAPRGRGGYEVEDQALHDTIHGDGGLYSSLTDLGKWLPALKDGRLLKHAWAKELPFQSGLVRTGKNKGNSVNYGFGFGIYDGPKGLGPEYYHEGEWVGFQNSIRYIKSQKTWMVLLSNKKDFDQSASSKAVDATLLKSGVFKPYFPSPNGNERLNPGLDSPISADEG